jgi:general nucleoside transport system ATP-binding protein
MSEHTSMSENVQPQPTSQTAEPVLKLDNIVKSFGRVVANKGVSFDVRPGEIHCLLGENGAGKTVLMSILYGMYQPDSGSITYKGKPLVIHSPREAIQHRIGMVHQHFMLVPTLTVAENVVLGQHRPWSVLNDMGQVTERIRELSQDLGLEVNANALVETLSVGEQQRVEILKTMYHGADLLILDEPTAVLTPQETVQLLHLLRNLADRGLTVIFITHKLEEVMQVSDRVTVLRDGRVIATVDTSGTNPRALARMMVGRDVLMTLPRTAYNPGASVLEVEGLAVMNERGQEVVHDLSFTVCEREIVGIAGVSGNGQTELALALSGLLPTCCGRIQLGGKVIEKLSPHELGHLGMAHLPEDRIKMGIILPFSVAENTILHEYNHAPYSRGGFLSFGTISKHAKTLVEKFDVRTAGVDTEIQNLSGGNQQKVVVARELQRDPRFMLVCQPTRGIDIGATEFVLQQILAQRDRGSAILLISTELEELFAVSDRILVMYEGRIVGEAPADRSYMEDVGLMMAGKRA